MRILLADNHQVLCEGLRTLISREPDMEIVGEAADGRAAVQLARRLQPDVVVMDVMMPELNGLEATRQVRAENPRIRVLALSMHTDQQYVIGMLEAGASGYVVKDSSFAEIARAIRAVAAGQTYLAASVAGAVVDVFRGARGVGPTTLSAREREVLQLLAEGWSTKDLASRIHVSAKTVETHRRNIMRKLDIGSLAELIRYALRSGIASLEDSPARPGRRGGRSG